MMCEVLKKGSRVVEEMIISMTERDMQAYLVATARKYRPQVLSTEIRRTQADIALSECNHVYLESLL